MTMTINRTVELQCDRCDEVLQVPFTKEDDAIGHEVQIAVRASKWYIRGPRMHPEEVLCSECGSLKNIRERVTIKNAKKMFIPHPDTNIRDEIQCSQYLRCEAMKSAKAKVETACYMLESVDDPADEIDDVSKASSLVRTAVGRTEMTNWELGLEDTIDAYF